MAQKEIERNGIMVKSKALHNTCLYIPNKAPHWIKVYQ